MFGMREIIGWNLLFSGNRAPRRVSKSPYRLCSPEQGAASTALQPWLLPTMLGYWVSHNGTISQSEICSMHVSLGQSQHITTLVIIPGAYYHQLEQMALGHNSEAEPGEPSLFGAWVLLELAQTQHPPRVDGTWEFVTTGGAITAAHRVLPARWVRQTSLVLSILATLLLTWRVQRHGRQAASGTTWNCRIRMSYRKTDFFF